MNSSVSQGLPWQDHSLTFSNTTAELERVIPVANTFHLVTGPDKGGLIISADNGRPITRYVGSSWRQQQQVSSLRIKCLVAGTYVLSTALNADVLTAPASTGGSLPLPVPVTHETLLPSAAVSLAASSSVNVAVPQGAVMAIIRSSGGSSVVTPQLDSLVYGGSPAQIFDIYGRNLGTSVAFQASSNNLYFIPLMGATNLQLQAGAGIGHNLDIEFTRNAPGLLPVTLRQVDGEGKAARVTKDRKLVSLAYQITVTGGSVTDYVVDTTGYSGISVGVRNGSGSADNITPAILGRVGYGTRALLTGSAITPSANSMIEVGPGLATVANASAAYVLPTTTTVRVTAGGGGSCVIDVDYELWS